MNRFWKIVIWIMLGLYIPIILSFISVSRQKLTCNAIKVAIRDSSEIKFVTATEVNDLIQMKFRMIQGSLINEINIEDVESVVREFPTIEDCQIYPSIDGTLCVNVDQRTPMLRVFDRGASYLIDSKGVKIPMRGWYKSHLMVVNGFMYKLDDYDDLLRITEFINDDSFWKAQIEQVFVESNGEFVLVPRVGQHKILFGDASGIDTKFRNLKALYQKGLHPLEWNNYKTINLKFKGQVICSKI